MLQTRYEFILRAKDPITHSAENLGNASIHARKRVRQPGGVVVDVPLVSGDAMRHQMREAATYGTLHAAGIIDDPQLSEGAIRLLFAGGMVTGRGDASVVNIERYNALAVLFPPLALFGGCHDNRPRPGQINVDELDMICTEQSSFFPPWVGEWLTKNNESLDTATVMVEEAQRVRMDPMLFPDKQKLLSGPARAEVENRALLAEAAHESGDAIEKKATKSTMMPRTHERIIQGALFWWGVEARTYSELELDAFNFTMSVLLNNLRVGGKAATGHGRLEFLAGERMTFAPIAGTLERIDGELSAETGLAKPVKLGDVYRKHVAERREELIAWLRAEMNA